MYYIYILTNRRAGTFYVGLTNDLVKRVYQHKYKMIDGFTKKYSIDKLVYYETTTDIESAIKREKQLKRWSRLWKIKKIELVNPEWNDLYDEII